MDDHVRRAAFVGVGLAASLSVGACAAFQQLLGVEAPRFEVVRDRPSVLTLDATSVLSGRPLARVRIWARVTNPNTFGLTVSRLRGDLFLEDREMADVDLPMGLPLVAARDTVIPIDISFGLPTLGSLGALGEALLRRNAVDYRLDGTVGIDAGAFGQPSFGPRTWLQGQFEVRTGRE
jgi:hypothetical protein